MAEKPSSAVIFNPAIAGLINPDRRQLRKPRNNPLPNPNRNVFRSWILQTLNFIEAMVVELRNQWRKCGFDFEKIDNKPGNRIGRTHEAHFHPIGVAVHSMASMCRGNIRETVCSLKIESLSYHHLMLTSL